MAEIIDKVQAIIAEKLSVDAAEVTPEKVSPMIWVLTH